MKEAIRFLNFKCVLSKRLMACLGAVIFTMALFIGQAQAFMFKTANPDLKVQFDNTLTYSVMNRLSDQNPKLLAQYDDTTYVFDTRSSDDGNRNFDKGLVMNRLDLWSEFDLSYKKFGIRVTGSAYYDTIYNKENDNDSPATVNHDTSDVPYNEFTDDTVELHGKNAELMEAFTFGSFYIGNSQFSYKAGQYALWWGTSFFMGGNGIADGMSPVNVSKAATLPNSQMKDVVLPIPQVSFDFLINSDWTVGAFYQLGWEHVRLWGSGSYFSPVDLLIQGGDRIIQSPVDGQAEGGYMARTKDSEPDASGQYGLKLFYQSPMGVDFGAYALNYHSRGPFVQAHPIDGEYHLYYPEDIKAYAVTANTSIGVWTVSTEITYRTNAPLVSNVAVFPNFGPFVNMNHEDDIVAKGDTLHALVNVFMPNLPSTALWDKADFIAEVGWNKCLEVTEHEELLDLRDSKGPNDSGMKIKAVLEPKQVQFLPAFDLITPIGFEYTPKGQDQVQDMGPDKGGMWTVGVGGTYDNKWDMYLTYVNYFGDAKYQSYADRDYVSFYLRYAF